MKHQKTTAFRGEFDPVVATRGAQAAMMNLNRGSACDDEPSNEHPRAEQWLYVISGMGTATVGRKRGALRRVRLGPGSLLIIERGELHQIRNTGRRPLRTINLYIPPAYRHDGKVRPAVKST
jgi:oxalate decarboxylase/phosphoglucose isomerase-like protein (cupin superfamily)